MANSDRVFIYDLQPETKTGRTTGFTFTVYYDETEAEAQVRLATPLPVSAQKDDAIAELRRLGEALLKAAQSPQSVFWQRPDQR